MRPQFLIYELIAIVAVIFFVWRRLKNQKSKPDTDTKRPSGNVLPSDKIVNDKLVIIENVSEEDIKKILQEFCNAYNKKSYQVILKLTQLSGNKFAIIFPYDIKFEIFCYFINYLNYPIGFDQQFKTVGWGTARPNDNWITEKSMNKKIMLFVSDFDKEYDNVFLTTSDNIGYKLGFAMGEEKEFLNNPEKNYEKPPLNVIELNIEEGVEFK